MNININECDRCGKKTEGTPGARGGHPGNACCCEDCLKVLAFDEAAEALGMTMMEFYNYLYDIGEVA